MTTPHAAPPPSGPDRSQSSTSLSRLYHGANGLPAEDENDPRLDFCNAFWGPGDRGYEVVMARLRGAGRTVDELRAFWKERIAIEEEYAKKLQKLSKVTLGRDEIGDLHGSLQHVLAETAQQANYHLALGTELRQSVEAPTAEFGVRLANLKRGLQGSVEKAYKNKTLQEGHANKAKERYEQDCLRLNSYTANLNLVQGKELEKIQQKLDRVRQTIGANEQDFRQFVRVLEGTSQKWEAEWKSFCDHVQDLEEDRLTLTKDIIWAYANAVSQVCVEDDSSCERIREKLEQFEPQNDMITFVRGWGTGDSIPDPPRFVNYAAGETFSSQPTTHPATFRRISSKPPGSTLPLSASQVINPAQSETAPEQPQAVPTANGSANDMPDVKGLSLTDAPAPAAQPHETASSPPAAKSPPFGGVALPGMGPPPVPAQNLPERRQSMQPPPLPGSMQMPEPRAPSRQSQVGSRDVHDEEDPMVRALANLRKEPPPPDSIRRNPSHRRADSVYSNQGSVRNSVMGVKSPASPGPGQIQSPPSPAPGQNQRQSYQQHPAARQSVDMGLSPPPGGHTAAALAKSMDEFHRQSSRDNRQSVNYSSFAEDVVGAHPSSRPTSPAPPAAARAPSPAMMQAPRQPPSPVADEVLSQYHQAFPGERSRSRANSINSRRSRAGSINTQIQPASNPQQPPPSPGREGFAGIGAGGGRSPSPQPPAFRSPSPNPSGAQGSLGPQNIGISLDEKGGVSHDSMAEAYRRQYQQSQQQQQQQRQGSAYSGSQGGHSQTAHSQQGYGQAGYGQPPKSPVGRPTSTYGSSQANYGQQGQGHYAQQQSQPAPGLYGQQQPAPSQSGAQNQYFPAYSPVQPQSTQAPAQPAQSPYQQTSVSSQQHGAQQAYPGQPQYAQQPQPQQQYGGYQQQQPPYGAPANQYNRAVSPAPPAQAPAQQQYGYRAPSPQPGYQAPQQQQMRGRTPSPQPNQPPANTAPTGQWSTTGQPVLFYVKALYDYTAQSAAEFDFQAGDIIAVTSTPEDGWWSGELLDEARRSPGRTDFPSNFVCLF